MDQGEKITDDIITLVMKGVEEEYGCQIDQEAILRGVACAYLAFASGLDAQQEAKEMIVDLFDKLDDPATLHWVQTHTPEDPEWLKRHRQN
jgi:hypothetical protein